MKFVVLNSALKIHNLHNIYHDLITIFLDSVRLDCNVDYGISISVILIV